MEENLDSSNSILSSNSCANSACQRKGDYSVGSNFDSPTPLPLKMNDLDLSELFRQLVYARFAKPPYDIFGGWKDDLLWAKIAEVMFKHNPLSQPTLSRLNNIVLKYDEEYTEDPELHNIQDSSLKNNICLVFNPVTTDKGCPRVEGLGKKRDRGKPILLREQPPVLPYMSSEQAHELILAKFGYTGLLAVQYEEDMDHLPIHGADWVFFFSNYGPKSSEYLSMANEKPAHRRERLRHLFYELKKKKSY